MENNFDLILAQLHMEEEELLLLAGLAFVQAQQGVPRRRRQRRRRRWWIKPYLQRRPIFGQYENLMVELYREDREDYQNFLRIKPDLFQELVERLGPLVKKKDTFWRKALNPELRIALTLRYLATDDSYKSIKYGFRVAENTISQIIPEGL